MSGLEIIKPSFEYSELVEDIYNLIYAPSYAKDGAFMLL